MKRIILLSAAIFMAMTGTAGAQVGLGTVSPDASATLDIYATDKGFLIPRMTTAERNAILLPAKGLSVFNTTTNATETNAGTPAMPIWTSPGSIYTVDADLTDNRTVTQGANPLEFTSTAVNGFSVDGNTFSVDAANNRVGIGTPAPAATLDVNGQARIVTLTDVTAAHLAVATDGTDPLWKLKLGTDANGGLVKFCECLPTTITIGLPTGQSTNYMLQNGSGEVKITVAGNGCGRWWSYVFNYDNATNFIQFSYSNGNPSANQPTLTGPNTYSLVGTMIQCADAVPSTQGGLAASIVYNAGVITITNLNNTTRPYLITECRNQNPVLDGTALPVFADNTAATTGGLEIGNFYVTATGDLKVRF